MVGISSQIGHSQRRVPVEVFRLDEALEQVPTHRDQIYAQQSLSILLQIQVSECRTTIRKFLVYRKKTPRLFGRNLRPVACASGSPSRIHLLLTPPPAHLLCLTTTSSPSCTCINRCCCCTIRISLIYPQFINPYLPPLHLDIVCHGKCIWRRRPIRVRAKRLSRVA